MIYKKAATNNKSAIVLLVIAVILGIGLLYQGRIISTLTKALRASEEERIHVSLGSFEDKIKGKEGTFVVAGKSKETMMFELAEVKAKLSKTEELFRKAKEERDILETENQKINKELALLKDELRLWEGKIDNLDEKKLVLERRNKSIKELRQRVWDFKVKAQEELDRIKTDLGNHGYLVKGGKTTFSRDRVVELEKIIVTHPAKSR